MIEWFLNQYPEIQITICVVLFAVIFVLPWAIRCNIKSEKKIKQWELEKLVGKMS